jgi:putative endonuclease
VKSFYVYILASRRIGTLNVGVTSDFVRRIWEHKSDLIDGFTKSYQAHRLVYFEETPDAECAIRREKQLKKWNRVWKLRLIESINPDWKDLYEEIA